MDVDKHYKNSIRIQLTAKEIDQGFVDITIDPYLVSKACNVGGGPIEHIMKKAMRGPDKGHSMERVYTEIIASANRGLQIERMRIK